VDSAVIHYRHLIADIGRLNTNEYNLAAANLFRLIWKPFEMQVTGLSGS